CARALYYYGSSYVDYW
nr:immunoglobulin heavy chain junction region [Mus musculus]MBK4188904.1 immunoglobulin heavy chain junction region [Mus musculus]